MMLKYFPYLLFCHICDAVIFKDVHWTTAITLSEYVGYRSMSMLSYDIPEQTESVQFSFTVKTSGNACQFREVQVYFQHGSFPLVTPHNETFPENFYLNRTDAYRVSLTKEEDIVTFVLSAPLPGTWYFASFLPKPTSDKIKQKGLSENCMYGMFVVVEAQGIDNIPEVSIEKSHSLHLYQDPLHYQVMYRYRLPYDTVQYDVVIKDCETIFLPQTSYPHDDPPNNEPDFESNGTPTYNISDPDSHVSMETLDNSTVSQLRDVRSSSSMFGPQENSPTSPSTSSTQSPPLSANAEMLPALAAATVVVSSTNSTAAAESVSPSAATTLPLTTPKPVVTSNKCPVSVFISSEKLPSILGKNNFNCSNTTSCSHSVLSPTLEKWTYLSIILDPSQNVSDIKFKLRLNMHTCESFKFILPRTIFEAQQLQPKSDRKQLSDLPQASCLLLDSLGRLKKSEDVFNVSFLLVGSGPLPVPQTIYDVGIPSDVVLVTSFQIQEHVDIGGTFRLRSIFNGNPKLMQNVHQYLVVYMCLMKNALPGGATVKSCDNGLGLLLNSSLSPSTEVYIPYPEAGSWYLGITGYCICTKTGLPVDCVVEPLINLDLGVAGCVEGQCGQYGVCGNFISGVHVFSSCRCFAGWRGYGCTDGTDGRTKSEELEAVLLLTLSNLFFLPAILLATYRRFYVEALVYMFTMFFSTFYHACDTSDIVYYCMFKYDILSFADFFGSISSFWVTMLAMADLRPGVRSFTHMLGVLGVAVGVEYDRHGLWVFVVPAGLALIIMFLSWILQCRRRHKLFPPKKYYLWHFLPGLLLALTGLVLFAFLETTDNYKYTHSAWHVAMSLSIVFLLPVPRRKGIDMHALSTESVEDGLTNSDSSMVLNAYLGLVNGHIASSSDSTNSNTDTNTVAVISSGDNLAYVHPSC